MVLSARTRRALRRRVQQLGRRWRAGLDESLAGHRLHAAGGARGDGGAARAGGGEQGRAEGEAEAYMAGNTAVGVAVPGAGAAQQGSAARRSPPTKTCRRPSQAWVAKGKLGEGAGAVGQGPRLRLAKLYGRASRGASACPPIPSPRRGYWVRQVEAGGGQGRRWRCLHPLLQRNTSDLSEQRYSSRLTGAGVLPRGPCGAGTEGAARRGLPGNGAGGGEARFGRGRPRARRWS